MGWTDGLLGCCVSFLINCKQCRVLWTWTQTISISMVSMPIPNEQVTTRQSDQLWVRPKGSDTVADEANEMRLEQNSITIGLQWIAGQDSVLFIPAWRLHAVWIQSFLHHFATTWTKGSLNYLNVMKSITIWGAQRHNVDSVDGVQPLNDPFPEGVFHGIPLVQQRTSSQGSWCGPSFFALISGLGKFVDVPGAPPASNRQGSDHMGWGYDYSMDAIPMARRPASRDVQSAFWSFHREVLI